VNLAGTGRLLRFHLRRDRLMLVWWVLGGAAYYWSQAVSTKGLYATQAAFDRAAANEASNAAFIAMAGPARALNTLGGQVAWQGSAVGAGGLADPEMSALQPCAAVVTSMVRAETGLAASTINPTPAFPSSASTGEFW